MAETRRTHSHDPSDQPLGGDPEATTAPAGNRPATGAREATAATVDPSWQGGQGATDFLGLEPDLRPSAAPGAEGAESGPTDSWLFEIEQGEAGPFPSPTSSAPQTRSESSTTDDGLEPGLEPEASDLEASDGPRATPRRGPGRLIAVLACLALLGVAGWFGWQRYGTRITRKVELALKSADPAPAPPAQPAPKPAAKPKPAPKPVASTPVKPEPTATASTATTPTTTPAPGPDPIPALASGPDVTTPAATTTSQPSGLQPVDPATPTGVAVPLVRSEDPARAPELPTSGQPGPGGGRHATAEDWAGMWLEPTIPTDAIRGPTRLRTLNVGTVRLQLTNGEYIEGTLNAVGESRVWLDVPLGRMSFAASDIRELTQIVGSQGQPLPAGAQALAGLKKVEVLMPGGSLTGRILDRQGDRVTFVTEEGMRLRVEALDVRPVSTGGSRLVGPVGSRKP